MLARSDALTAVSRRVAAYLGTAGADRARVHVIGNAVDTAQFHPGLPAASLPSVPKNVFVVGFTGALKMWHGVDTLLSAFGTLRRAEPRAHLLICGDGPKRGWIEGFVAGAGLEDSVTFAGWVDHAALPGLIARMDVETAPCPAGADHYFSPLKLYEYLAMGRPVVASDISQTAELLAFSDAAVLRPPGNAGSLARTLRALCRDPDRRRAMFVAAPAEGTLRCWTRNAAHVLRLGASGQVAA